MEKITIEQIEAVKTRANVGYKEAKEVLEKFDGDVVSAILYLEENKKIKADIKDDTNRYYDKGKRIIKKLNKIEVKIYKKEKIALNIPATLVIIFTLIAPHVTMLGLAISIVTGYRVKVENLKGDAEKINVVLDKATTKGNEFTNKAIDEINKEINKL